MRCRAEASGHAVLRDIAALAALAALLLLALMPPARAAGQAVPFDQVLDLAVLRQVIEVPPDRLLATIAQRGVRVLRVATPQPARPLNPHLAALPEADAALLRDADFRDSYEGRLVPGRSGVRDTILIRDTASDYTLLHEFAQTLLRPLRRTEADDAIELRFAAAFHRLTLYQRRLYDDPYRLLDPLWRRDILTAQLDVARDLFERIRLGQSQEAIVEKLLARLIDERSPYFDAARRTQGWRYGAVMIDNAIDTFNAVQQSSRFVVDAVSRLRAAVLEGDIEPAAAQGLDDAAVAAAERGAREVEALLAPVRTELQVLKRFYEDG